MRNYEQCKACGCINKKEEDERIEKCVFCGLDVDFVQASEIDYRKFYIGTLMQPFTYNKIKLSVQTTFIVER